MKIGLENLSKRGSKYLADLGSCALLCNQASLTQEMAPAWHIIKDLIGERLKCLFSPQHGLDAVVQDNMLETGHFTHRYTGLPVYSLYSETREPTEAMLAGVDTILIDLQIVGCRVYTFKYTVAACLRAAKKLGLKVVILDRPNPVGGRFVEGPVLDKTCRSFVGEFSIPMRHGLSVGEAASLFNFEIGADLDIIDLSDWDPNKLLVDQIPQWVLTSPNLPTFDSVLLYPGTVLFEGTNISEGRGTALPFTMLGAPYIDSGELVSLVCKYYGRLLGFYLRPASFSPTSQKWADQVCHGLQVVVTDPELILPFRLGLAILKGFIELGGKHFSWSQPPYEYNFETLPIKLIFGSPDAHNELRDCKDIDGAYWQAGCKEYISGIGSHLLYSRDLTVG